MENTPKGSRLHIAIFGRRNAGKSSLINALTGQDIALVSPVAGTTTDPVYKAMEILPVGPVMLIDTAGIDDTGDLGKLRVEKTMQVLAKTDLAILVVSFEGGLSQFENSIAANIKARSLPLITVINKSDLQSLSEKDRLLYAQRLGCEVVEASAKTGQGIEELKQLIIKNAPDDWQGPPILRDLINQGDTVLFVTPIDACAPKGRLILPQNQAIRDVLDHNSISIVVQEGELGQSLGNLKKLPKLIVTDSQAFKNVSEIAPEEILLTSFSILYARHKGDLGTLVEGAKAAGTLKTGDKVLIAEGCTHHCQSADIGRVKIPRLLKQYANCSLDFDWVSGGEFPLDLGKYKLTVHCGACMLNRREVLSRLSLARSANVPIVNYGVLIAKILGILPRALKPFPTAEKILG